MHLDQCRVKIAFDKAASDEKWLGRAFFADSPANVDVLNLISIITKL